MRPTDSPLPPTGRGGTAWAVSTARRRVGWTVDADLALMAGSRPAASGGEGNLALALE